MNPNRDSISRVYAYAAYRIGPGPDAEDVTSETFERAIRYRASFDPKRGDSSSWLIGIARRVIADRAMRALPTDVVPHESVEGPEAHSLRAIDLAAAVATLGERDREIIALRFGADLTAKEIARVLELRANTVEVALHRALSTLRVELERTEVAAPSEFAAPAPNGS